MRLILTLLLALWVAPVAAQEPLWASQCPAAVEHIIRWEVGGVAAYTRRYTRPVCPACLSTASGVTIGAGYDLAHAPPHVIRADWRDHPQVERLPPASGLGGQRAIDMTRSMQDVVTPWELAYGVFKNTSLHAYTQRTRRAYPGFDHLSSCAQGILVATSYNRGTAMQGIKRRHLRAIRDVCVPAKDTACMAEQLAASTVLWQGTPVYNGLRARYLDAAAIVRR